VFRARSLPLTRSGFVLAIVVLAALLPTLVTAPVWRSIAVQIAINACVALGMTLLFGFAGQISLAQAAFMGIGAFAPAILAIKHGMSPWWGLPVGIVIAAVLAAVIGAPVLRLEGLYLAMATTALNIVMVVVAEQLTAITGGPFGLAGLHPLSFFGLDLINVSNFYYVVLTVLMILYLLAYRLLNSPIGVMLAALRHDPRAAALAGVPVPVLKVKVFAMSAAYAAVGGFFLAEYLLLASPEQYTIIASLYFLLMVVVGGTKSLPGAIIGAAFVTVMPQLMPGLPREQQIVFAVAYLIIVVLLPDGIAGIISSVWRRVRSSFAEQPPAPVREGEPA
jgi:branched-chain amino acid transport system permease protein